MKKILYVLLPLSALFSLSSAQPSKQDPLDGIPKPTHAYVNDYTGTMLTAGQIALLNHSLRQYQDSTSSQIVVMILNTLPKHNNGQQWNIEEFTNNAFRVWKPGQKGTNNGVLLLILLKDKHARIATGTGTEGAIPDVTALNIIRHDMKPQFDKGDYYRTVTAGINGIKKALGHEFAAKTKPSADKPFPVFGIVLIFVALIVIVGTIILISKSRENDVEDDEEPLVERRPGRYSPQEEDDSPGIMGPLLAASVIESSERDRSSDDDDDDDEQRRSSSSSDDDDNDSSSSSSDDDTFDSGGGDTSGGGADSAL